VLGCLKSSTLLHHLSKIYFRGLSFGAGLASW
jgi:hypothetical protein